MSDETRGSLAPTVVFASDYGLADPFVGLCHLVVARVGATLGARVDVVDLCHELPAFDVGAGGALLHDALPWIPAGNVVLAVVDPGVGTDRAGVVVRVDSSAAPGRIGGQGSGDAGAGGAGAVGPLHLVGPDNGLLTAAAGEHLHRAWRIGEVAPPWPAAGEAVGATFDGRDVFAPVAARLAVDTDAALGGLEPVAVDELVAWRQPRGTVEPGRIDAEVVRVDGFGNLLLAVSASAIGEAGWQQGQPVRLRTGEGIHHAVVARAFDELGEGELGVLADAFGRLQVVVDRGDAGRRLGLGAGARLSVHAAAG